MDELSAVQRLLAEPPPGPDVVEAARLRLESAALGGTPPHTRAAGRSWHAARLVRRATGPRRRPGWLAPVAAAAAAAGVIVASLAVSGAILRGTAGTGPANSSGVFAKVPRYFVAIRGHAIVGETATGAVLGTVTPPKPHTVFVWLGAAGDDRTFVLATSPRRCPCPLRFYRLVLDRSGRPGRLAPLPIPPQTPANSGLALSPDGSKLAVSLPPVYGHHGSKIQVFSLATGARRQWVWPGQGIIGSNSWAADSRTLLFEMTTFTKAGRQGQLRLLDTAAPTGSMLASSTRIPIPGTEVGWQRNAPYRSITGIPLITANGTKLVALVFHQGASSALPPKVRAALAKAQALAKARADPAKVRAAEAKAAAALRKVPGALPRNFVTITEFSARTGKPVGVLYRGPNAGVWWVNASATAMIAIRGWVVGVQTPTTFTPLPPRTQRLLYHHRQPLWSPAW